MVLGLWQLKFSSLTATQKMNCVCLRVQNQCAVEARHLEHERLPFPNQRKTANINHPTSMFHFLESTVAPAVLGSC